MLQYNFVKEDKIQMLPNTNSSFCHIGFLYTAFNPLPSHNTYCNELAKESLRQHNGK